MTPMAFGSAPLVALDTRSAAAPCRAPSALTTGSTVANFNTLNRRLAMSELAPLLRCVQTVAAHGGAVLHDAQGAEVIEEECDEAAGGRAVWHRHRAVLWHR